MVLLPCVAGFTCIIQQDQLSELCAGHDTAGLPDWEDFKADMQAGSIHFPSIRTPFLFAGKSTQPASCNLWMVRSVVPASVAVASGTAGGQKHERTWHTAAHRLLNRLLLTAVLQVLCLTLLLQPCTS